MNGLVCAEFRKLTTVRTTWIITAVGLFLVALTAGLFLFQEDLTGPFTGTDGELAALVDQIGGNSVIVLVIALLVMTTEFRHGTIGRTLQVTPSRTTVLTAKLLIGVIYGLLFFLAGLVVVVVLVVISGEDVSLGEQTAASLWQGPVGLGLTAMFGVAVGALVRNQVVAITVTLVYVFVGETIFNQFFPEIARWLPFQALNAVFLSDEAMANMPEGMLSPLDPPVGLIVFVGYVTVFAAAAIVLMRKRDV